VRAAIRGVFDDALNCSVRDQGCFLVNAATELLRATRKSAGWLHRRWLGRNAHWPRRCAAASGRRIAPGAESHRADRPFPGRRAPGLRVMVKATPGSAALRDMVAVTLRAID